MPPSAVLPRRLAHALAQPNSERPEMPWSSSFDEPIELHGGRKLMTLQQAADYIMKLPNEAQQQDRWQVAVENLINAAEIGGGWLMFARIAMLQALNGDRKQR